MAKVQHKEVLRGKIKANTRQPDTGRRTVTMVKMQSYAASLNHARRVCLISKYRQTNFF